jgi:hypothetical protein
MVMTTFPKQSANRHWFEQKSCQNSPKTRRPALIYTTGTGFNKNQAETSQNTCRPALVLQKPALVLTKIRPKFPKTHAGQHWFYKNLRDQACMQKSKSAGLGFYNDLRED